MVQNIITWWLLALMIGGAVAIFRYMLKKKPKDGQ